jgi:hypothetical protein
MNASFEDGRCPQAGPEEGVDDVIRLHGMGAATAGLLIVSMAL